MSQKATHISSETYTEYKASFGLYKEQSEIIQKWKTEHDQARHIKLGATHRYAGAIGGAYTYEFTPTSVGVVTKVTCACGEAIDVSNYDEW